MHGPCSSKARVTPARALAAPQEASGSNRMNRRGAPCLQLMMSTSCAAASDGITRLCAEHQPGDLAQGPWRWSRDEEPAIILLLGGMSVAQPAQGGWWWGGVGWFFFFFGGGGGARGTGASGSMSVGQQALALSLHLCCVLLARVILELVPIDLARGS